MSWDRRIAGRSPGRAEGKDLAPRWRPWGHAPGVDCRYDRVHDGPTSCLPSSIPVPAALVGLTSTLVERLPFLPAEMEWVHVARHPMLMDTTKARRQLGWAPAYTAHETLTAMVDAERDRAEW